MWHKITTVSHLKVLYTVRKRPKEVLGNSATTQSKYRLKVQLYTFEPQSAPTETHRDSQ